MGHSARLNARTKNYMAVIAFSRDVSEISRLTMVEIYPEATSIGDAAAKGAVAKGRKASKRRLKGAGKKTSGATTPPASWKFNTMFVGGSSRSPPARRAHPSGSAGDATAGSSASSASTGASRLLEAREKYSGTPPSAWRDDPAAHGLGSSGGAFSPDVAALLADPSILKLASPLFFACYSGHVGSILVALKFFRKLLRNGMFDGERERSKAPLSSDGTDQMTLFDFAVKAVADTTELGHDVVYPAALHFIVDVVERSTKGLHPITMHLITSAVKRAHAFFEQIDDYKRARKAAKAKLLTKSGTLRKKPSFAIAALAVVEEHGRRIDDADEAQPVVEEAR